jgi:hypothetical protein
MLKDERRPNDRSDLKCAFLGQASQANPPGPRAALLERVARGLRTALPNARALHATGTAEVPIRRPKQTRSDGDSQPNPPLSIWIIPARRIAAGICVATTFEIGPGRLEFATRAYISLTIIKEQAAL